MASLKDLRLAMTLTSETNVNAQKSKYASKSGVMIVKKIDG